MFYSTTSTSVFGEDIVTLPRFSSVDQVCPSACGVPNRVFFIDRNSCLAMFVLINGEWVVASTSFAVEKISVVTCDGVEDVVFSVSNGRLYYQQFKPTYQINPSRILPFLSPRIEIPTSPGRAARFVHASVLNTSIHFVVGVANLDDLSAQSLLWEGSMDFSLHLLNFAETSLPYNGSRVFLSQSSYVPFVGSGDAEISIIKTMNTHSTIGTFPIPDGSRGVSMVRSIPINIDTVGEDQDSHLLVCSTLEGSIFYKSASYSDQTWIQIESLNNVVNILGIQLADRRKIFIVLQTSLYDVFLLTCQVPETSPISLIVQEKKLLFSNINHVSMCVSNRSIPYITTYNSFRDKLSFHEIFPNGELVSRTIPSSLGSLSQTVQCVWTRVEISRTDSKQAFQLSHPITVFLEYEGKVVIDGTIETIDNLTGLTMSCDSLGCFQICQLLTPNTLDVPKLTLHIPKVIPSVVDLHSSNHENTTEVSGSPPVVAYEYEEVTVDTSTWMEEQLANMSEEEFNSTMGITDPNDKASEAFRAFKQVVSDLKSPPNNNNNSQSQMNQVSNDDQSNAFATPSIEQKSAPLFSCEYGIAADDVSTFGSSSSSKQEQLGDEYSMMVTVQARSFAFGGFFKNLFNFIQDKWESVKAGVVNACKSAIERVTEGFKIVQEWVVNGVRRIAEFVINTVREAVAFLKDCWQSIKTGCEDFFNRLAVNFSRASLQRTKSGCMALVLKSKSFLTGAITYMENKITSSLTVAENYINDHIQEIIDSISSYKISDSTQEEVDESKKTNNKLAASNSLMNSLSKQSSKEEESEEGGGESFPVDRSLLDRLMLRIKEFVETIRELEAWNTVAERFTFIIQRDRFDMNTCMEIIALFLTVVQGITSTVFGFTKTVIGMLCDVIRQAIDSLFDLMFAEIDMGYISKLYCAITGSQSMSVADILCMVTSVQINLLCSITKQPLPFEDDITLSRFTSSITRIKTDVLFSKDDIFTLSDSEREEIFGCEDIEPPQNGRSEKRWQDMAAYICYLVSDGLSTIAWLCTMVGEKDTVAEAHNITGRETEFLLQRKKDYRVDFLHNPGGFFGLFACIASLPAVLFDSSSQHMPCYVFWSQCIYTFTSFVDFFLCRHANLSISISFLCNLSLLGMDIFCHTVLDNVSKGIKIGLHSLACLRMAIPLSVFFPGCSGVLLWVVKLGDLLAAGVSGYSAWRSIQSINKWINL